MKALLNPRLSTAKIFGGKVVFSNFAPWKAEAPTTFKFVA